MDGVAKRTVERWRDVSRTSRTPEFVEDVLAGEEPLEIRISGDTLAVTMRTPGHDRELVLGFLWSEGIIRSPRDVSSLAPCARAPNVVDVTLAPGVKPPEDADAPFARRGTLTTSACGVCGRRTIDDLVTRHPPLRVDSTLAPRVITTSIAALRDRQPLFAATGGCHAASLVTFAGEPIDTFEDVGRHNAVDKVIGASVRRNAMPLDDRVLVVSGRSSFEIVQKAIAARIPVVVSVSAPSSLAVDLARAAGVTLCGFVRGDGFSVYASPERFA